MGALNRRDFLMRSGGALMGVPVGPQMLNTILPAHAAQAAVQPEMVRLRPAIEPVVRWIERTERSKILDVAAVELAKGLPYRELLAGLFLAGIRNIQPRPMGFKFHAVMVVSSAHQLSLDAPQQDRLYPLFWALDYFKRAQADDVSEGDWWLGPPNEPKVPGPRESRKLLSQAMEQWDAEAADAAVTGLCRSAGAGELMESLWTYGGRNHRNIGHHIIFTAHAFRTLQVIGWQHAEPVLRSLVYGIVNGRRGESSAEPFETNRELVKTIRPDWAAGRQDEAAMLSLLATLRQANAQEAAQEVAALLNRGVSADSLWEAVLLAAGELLMRNPGILSLHAVTSSSSQHYAYRVGGTDATRLLMLLQAASWNTLYRQGGGEASTKGPRIDKLEPADDVKDITLEGIFDEMGRDRLSASRQILAYAQQGGSAEAFMDVGRNLIFNKGAGSHDYKFSAAVFEELVHAQPRRRGQMMAASAFYLKAATDADSSLRERTHAALARISV